MQPFRLGFAVKVLGAGGMPTADHRRWQSGPHLRRSAQLLDLVFDYLDRIDVRVYRLSSQAIPYGTHPDLPQFDYRRQLDEAAVEVEQLARKAAQLGLRLSTHPGQYTVINALDPVIAAKAIADIEANAVLLDRLNQGPEAAIVVHVGGSYGDKLSALTRWAQAWERLTPQAQARLALENDERLFDLDDVLDVHRRTGVRVVLDVHHHRIHSARRVPLVDAMSAAAATWPAGQRPKIHLSSPVTMLPAGRGGSAMPPLRNHADLISPWDLEATMHAAPVPVDVMLEAKAKDLALLRLRADLATVRPELSALEQRTMPEQALTRA